MCGGVGVTIITMWICYICYSVLPKIHSSLQIGRWSCVCSLFTILCSVASWWAPFGAHSGAEHSGDLQVWCRTLWWFYSGADPTGKLAPDWERVGGRRERELARSNNCPCWLSLWGRRWRISTVLVDPSRPCTGNATSTEGSGWLTNILSVYIKVDSEPRHCSRDYNSFIPSHRSRARIEAASLPLQILI